MIALGVDPGYAACGVALVEQQTQSWRCLGTETIRTPPRLGLDDRLELVWERLEPWFGRGAEVVGLEDQQRAQEGARSRGESSHGAKGVLIVEGLVRGLAWSHGAKLVRVQPQQARRALGLPARASKRQVGRAAAVLVPGYAPRTEHEGDALAAAVAAARRSMALGRRP